MAYDKEYARRYYLAHRSTIKARIKKSAEHYRAYRHKWYLKNKEHVRIRNKKWSENNREKERAAGRAWYHRNKHRTRAKRIAKAKAWYQRNKDRILPIKTLRYRKLLIELRNNVFGHYGNRCNCCGLTDTHFLSVDHVNYGKGNGIPKTERKIGTSKMYEKIIAEGYPAEYQILCMNCNWAKGIYGKCPHQTEKIDGQRL